MAGRCKDRAASFIRHQWVHGRAWYTQVGQKGFGVGEGLSVAAGQLARSLPSLAGAVMQAAQGVARRVAVHGNRGASMCLFAQCTSAPSLPTRLCLHVVLPPPPAVLSQLSSVAFCLSADPQVRGRWLPPWYVLVGAALLAISLLHYLSGPTNTPGLEHLEYVSLGAVALCLPRIALRALLALRSGVSRDPGGVCGQREAWGVG